MDELVEKLKGEGEGFKIIGFAKRELIRRIEFKRRFSGIGVVGFTIHTVDGKRLKFNLIYGKGIGMDKEEAVEKAVKTLKKLGTPIEKKI